MKNQRSSKRVMTQKRSAWQLGTPGGMLWLLKWLALLALVALLILAVVPSDTTFADSLHNAGSPDPPSTSTVSATE